MSGGANPNMVGMANPKMALNTPAAPAAAPVAPVQPPMPAAGGGKAGGVATPPSAPIAGQAPAAPAVPPQMRSPFGGMLPNQPNAFAPTPVASKTFAPTSVASQTAAPAVPRVGNAGGGYISQGGFNDFGEIGAGNINQYFQDRNALAANTPTAPMRQPTVAERAQLDLPAFQASGSQSSSAPATGGGKGGGRSAPPAAPTAAPTYAPNINTTAAQGINAAMAGAQREMGYRPMAVKPSGYGAAQTGFTGFNPSDVMSQGYNAANTGATGVTARDIQAGQLAGTDLSAYTNPYENQVVQSTLGDLDRARQMAMAQTGAQATAAGAFGGSRQGVMEAETNRAFAEQAAKSAGQLRSAGFNQAQGMAQQDIAGRMQASLANQGANLQAGTTTANLGQQANLANMSALNQASQFGAQAANQAAAQYAAQVQAANQYGAQAQNQASMANMAALNQAGQFNATAAQQANLANQAAGLSGAQQRLAAAGQLGSQANTGFNMGQIVQQNLAQQGLAQQALQQQLIEAAKAQYAQYTGAPYQSIGLLGSALTASPIPQSQQTTKQLGAMDYLTMAAGLAGSDRRLKKNIEKAGSLPNGLNLYTWDWKEEAIEKGLSNSMTLGVIAQEVQDVMPDMVTMMPSGYLAVKYGELYKGL